MRGGMFLVILLDLEAEVLVRALTPVLKPHFEVLVSQVLLRIVDRLHGDETLRRLLGSLNDDEGAVLTIQLAVLELVKLESEILVAQEVAREVDRLERDTIPKPVPRAHVEKVVFVTFFSIFKPQLEVFVPHALL